MSREDGELQLSAINEAEAEPIGVALRSRPLRPYETLSSTDRWRPATQRAADEIMHAGWADRRSPRFSLEPPVDWDATVGDRTWLFHLHSWDFLGPVLATYEHTEEKRYLRWAIAVTNDWTQRYSVVEASRMAWYDMAIGLRGYRLGYVVDAAAHGGCTEDEFRGLVQCARLHFEAFTDDTFFAPHSNHGLYFSAGHLALARRLEVVEGIGRHSKLARERIHQLIDTQFTSEGVHREHSPDYHRMISETLSGLIEAGLVDAGEFGAAADRAQEALSWFVLPNGRIAAFGDSPHRRMMRKGYDDVSNATLRFAVSGGASGEPPADLWRQFDTGYWVARDGWPAGTEDYADWSYVAQTAQFHSRMHKHADDLAIIWYDQGSELLVEPGRFGYLDPVDPDSDLARAGFYYGHPKRIYVESTRAHNTVEIDGRAYQRRGVKPYGSGLLEAGEFGGVFYSAAHVRHNKTIRHARVVAFRPREWLLVYDWLWDNDGEPHRYTQRFHLGPDLDILEESEGVLEEGNRLTLSLPGDERLWMLALLPASLVPPVRGQEEPELLGWISRRDGEFEPTWTVAYEQAGEPTCSLATLFTFAEARAGSSSVTSRGRQVDLCWEQSGVRWTVSFGRPDLGDFDLTVEVGVGD